MSASIARLIVTLDFARILALLLRRTSLQRYDMASKIKHEHSQPKKGRCPLWFEDQLPGYRGDANASGLRKRLRRKDVAAAFSVGIRTVDYWWKVTKFLPPPHFLERLP